MILKGEKKEKIRLFFIGKFIYYIQLTSLTKISQLVSHINEMGNLFKQEKYFSTFTKTPSIL